MSGCSGGGKSTLLAELARRGHAIVEEPGRRVVRQQQAIGGSALPWIDMAAFARRAIDMALADREAAGANPGWTFFDRGLVDAAAALEAATGEPAVATLGATHRYHRLVFLTPPWPALFENDAERQHGWDDALAEYARLTVAYPSLGYETRELPLDSVEKRADWLLAELV